MESAEVGLWARVWAKTDAGKVDIVRMAAAIRTAEEKEGILHAILHKQHTPHFVLRQ
jgi:hypothetical protein